MAMDSNDTVGGSEGVFIVRQTEAQGGGYAICARVATLGGGERLVGFSETVADLVEKQKLLAAFAVGGSTGTTETFSFEPQSGENVSLRFKRR